MSSADDLPGIPRVIHQTWRDRDFSTVVGDPASWTTHNPGWTYMFWSDEDLARFFAEECPEYRDLYETYGLAVQRADLARYAILRRYGGVYADIDTRCLASLEPLAGDRRVVVCQEPSEHFHAARIRGLSMILFNGTLASPAGHPFWDDMLARCRLMADRRHIDVLDSTGPLLLTAAALQWPDANAISINSCQLFAGLTNTKTPSDDVAAGDYGHLKLSEHLWQGSWFNPPRRSAREDVVTALRRVRHRLIGGARHTSETAVAGIDVDLLRSPIVPQERPAITILIPARDAADHLPRCFELLLSLDYPKDRLRVVFGHGNSRDGSGALIAAFCEAQRDTFAEVRQVEIRNNAPRVGRHRRALPKFQRRRRAGIARARNELLAAAIAEPTDWYLWIDADLADYPPTILDRLLAEREKIVTPNCLMVGTRSSFDLNAFLCVDTPPDGDFYRYLKGGLFQPPDNYWGRRHLHDLRYLPRIPLHSVGGTMLLVAASVHKAGLGFPDLPYKGVIETEAFGLLARELGVIPIGLPQVEIYHG